MATIPLKTLPLAFVLANRRSALIGGDDRAHSKADLLLGAGAGLDIYSDCCGPALAALAEQHDNCRIQPLQTAAEAPPPQLVVVGWEDSQPEDAGRKALIDMARHWGVPVNVVDDPAHCDFIFPAMVRRGEVQVAITTGGRAPLLARLLRERLEALLPTGLEYLAVLLDKFGGRMRRQGMAAGRRRALLERLATGSAGQAAEAGDIQRAERLAEAAMQADEQDGEAAQEGCIYMVGAGPGNPDLLTLRGLQLLQRADVILYDRLVPEAVLNLARRESERVLVGKTPGGHSTPQAEINRMMVEQAQAGRRICRLKSGDPFVFGRGGEELEGIAGTNIPVEVVPGISAASGCAAWEGIPLTHRDFAHSCLFVTAHGSAEAPAPDWKNILTPGQTVVVFMPLSRLGDIVRECQQSGVSPDWPVALIERGTQPQHRALYCTLSDLAQKAEALSFQSPSLLICGEVTALGAMSARQPTEEPAAFRPSKTPSDAD